MIFLHSILTFITYKRRSYNAAPFEFPLFTNFSQVFRRVMIFVALAGWLTPRQARGPLVEAGR
jgi:hypothetical protein